MSSRVRLCDDFLICAHFHFLRRPLCYDGLLSNTKTCHICYTLIALIPGIDWPARALGNGQCSKATAQIVQAVESISALCKVDIKYEQDKLID